MPSVSSASPGRTMSLGAAVAGLGIVFGDLGTSPLYTMQAIVGVLGPGDLAASALGVLSLIFWTLVITVSVKYALLVMRADNHGEGGILALLSKVGLNDWRRGTYVGAAMGLLGAALIYGDGVITPSISVLSAVEGVKVVTSALQPMILPLATGILALLFVVQRFGTGRIARAFGPVMLVWFVTIGLLGAAAVIRRPEVLQAVNPVLGVRLLASHGRAWLLLLGAVFLCSTGAEALYADMGHIGRGSIRLGWYAVVLPALLLNYAGQTTLLLAGLPGGGNPFFRLAPAWAVGPLVVLATIATVIASQAIITGSFSMTRQAVQLGWLPGVRIRQTSDKFYGQIYVPLVNSLMAVATIAVTLGFRSSDRLAGAYGTAVSTTMVLTSLLLLRVMRRSWRWPILAVVAVGGVFLLVDGSFFVANIIKVADGGWVPLCLGLALFLTMVTWRTGVQAVRDRLAETTEPAERFLAKLAEHRIPRVPGVGVFLASGRGHVPAYVIQYVHIVGALHRAVVLLNVRFEETPRVDEPRWRIEPVAEGMWRVTLRYGFIEIPDVASSLAQGPCRGPPFDTGEPVFFASHDLIQPCGHGGLARWRLKLFALLYRNAVLVTERFSLPPDRTLEIARELRL